MIIFNLNARVLTDKSIFVQYQEEGKAKDASFRTWMEFADWLKTKVAHDDS
jgi:hypothetical protein